MANIDAPQLTFGAASTRVAAILVGLGALTLANLLLAEDNSTRSLSTGLRSAAQDLLRLADDAIGNRRRSDPEELVDLSARLAPLRSEIGFATPEQPNARRRAAGGRSALLGLYEAITAVQAVGVGLGHAGPLGRPVSDATALARSAIRRQEPERCLARFDELALEALRSGSLRVEDAHLLDRLRALITTMGDIREARLDARRRCRCTRTSWRWC